MPRQGQAQAVSVHTATPCNTGPHTWTALPRPLAGAPFCDDSGNKMPSANTRITSVRFVK